MKSAIKHALHEIKPKIYSRIFAKILSEYFISLLKEFSTLRFVSILLKIQYFENFDNIKPFIFFLFHFII